MATRRPRTTALEPGPLLTKLVTGDPEARFLAAQALAHASCRSALVPLEQVALHDDDTCQREGAFVDTTEAPSQAALSALRRLYETLTPVPADIVRVRAHLLNQAIPPDRREALAATLGAAAVDAAEPLTRHADPALRLLAHNVLGRAQRARSNHVLWLDDEAVRLAAAAQDPYRSGLVRDALARFPDEPSPRVRQALCDLWLRYRARMGGSLKSWELVDLLTDADPAIQERVARHVVAAAARQAVWVDDPAGLQKTRDRLRRLPRVAVVVDEALALVERACAPFERG